ncbi:cardiolipin synthase [Bacillus tianshenii]|nr:cardiolipin synthase [Bacillus tianshenii]
MKKGLQVLVFIVGIAVIMYFTNDYWGNQLLGWLSLLASLSAVFIGAIIFLENRHPTKTLTWLVVLAVFPVLGFFFYLIFGQSYRKKRTYQRKAWLDEQAFAKIEGNRQINERDIEQMGGHQKLLFKLAHRLGKSPISFASETKVLTDGEEKFEELKKWLKRARHHIHLEYYIVRNDDIGKELKDILIERAQKGVEVRFLYDAVGSWQLSRSYIHELRENGVEVVPFSPVKIPLLNSRINFRNHRKIVVIDGNVGFVGGINVGDEYLGRDEYFGHWRDTHLFVKGEGVRSLQLIFLQDWYYMTGKPLLTPNYLSPDLVHEENLGGVQMLAGGPDNDFDVIKNVYFSMIISAKESIWIATPYFIPDEDILSALRIAALSGVDVRILMPSRPDKRIVFHASRSYFPELLEAGARIYEYERGFLHSKIVIVDKELASIGTSNMDMRSFHLNFEVNAFLYKTKSTQKLVQDFLDDLENSSELDYDTFKKRSFFLRLFESTSRLLSPLL